MSSLFNRTFSVLGGSLLCCCYGFHRPDQPIASAKPRGPHERSTASNVATKQFVRRIKPAGTCRERFLQRYQSPIDPIYQFGRYAIRGLHYGVGETVDPLLSTHQQHGKKIILTLLLFLPYSPFIRDRTTQLFSHLYL